MAKKYQIGLSFAGEDRPYVDSVARALLSREVRVFYDSFEQVELWGKNLYQHLAAVYRDQCDYVILFISKHYATKPWCKLELESVQARSFEELSEYILPVRFDDVEITGLQKTRAYLDLRNISPKELAEKVVQKLGNEGLIPVPTHAEVSQDDLKHPTGFKILYSANSYMAYRIAKQYYNDLHYVWCSADFGSLVSANTGFQRTPTLTRPKHRYYQMLKEVNERVRGALTVEEARHGLLRGVEAQRQAGRINMKQAEEILSIVQQADISDFRPLLYVLPVTSELLPRIQVVPVKQRAHPLSEEFIISDLKSDEFDIITLDPE